MPLLQPFTLPKVRIADVAQHVPHVWVGCLGCYNEGRLVGFWVAAEHAPATMSGDEDYDPEDETNQHFNALLDDKATPVAPDHFRAHTELFVAVHENMGGLFADHDTPADARRAGALIEALSAVPMQPEVFGTWWRDQNPGLSLLDRVEADDVERILKDGTSSVYRGKWPTLGSYAESETSELYDLSLKALPAEVRLAIDWQEVGETWESNGRITSYAWHDGVYVFENVG